MAAETRPVLNSDGSSSGTRVNAAKYASVHAAILRALPADAAGMSYKGLVAKVRAALSGFEGSIPWYVTTVKLDMEGRGEIERIAGASPQRLRKTGR